MYTGDVSPLTAHLRVPLGVLGILCSLLASVAGDGYPARARHGRTHRTARHLDSRLPELVDAEGFPQQAGIGQIPCLAAVSSGHDLALPATEAFIARGPRGYCAPHSDAPTSRGPPPLN